MIKTSSNLTTPATAPHRFSGERGRRFSVNFPAINILVLFFVPCLVLPFCFPRGLRPLATRWRPKLLLFCPPASRGRALTEPWARVWCWKASGSLASGVLRGQRRWRTSDLASSSSPMATLPCAPGKDVFFLWDSVASSVQEAGIDQWYSDLLFQFKFWLSFDENFSAWDRLM